MEFEEKRLGILGGMGPQATRILYQWVLDRTDADCDQEHIPTIILSDTKIPDRTQAILSGDTEIVEKKLIADAKTLVNCGAACIAIPCNTSHYFADAIEASIPVPLLHMPRLAVKHLADEGRKKVALLATDGTVQTGIYHKEAKRVGIEILNPPPEIQNKVMSLIYDEIKQGEKGNRRTFAVIDRAVKGAGCDGAILACTELSVFNEYHHLPEFYADAMAILADACVDFFGKARTNSQFS